MLANIYKQLQKKIPTINNSYFKDLVNFSSNSKLPIHRWYEIKEGYSNTLVQSFIDRYSIKNNDIIMDPFSGSGTTLLTAKQNNIDGIGFEINPFLKFVASNKIINLSKKEKQLASNCLKKIKFSKKINSSLIPKLSISRKLFGNKLGEITNLKQQINKINKKKIRNLFFLAFLCILENCSIAKKDGNGLKYKIGKKQLDVKKQFINKVKQILQDLQNNSYPNSKQILFNEDIRKLNQIIKNKKFNIIKKNKNKISLIIFSPPYMNCFDYTEVYKIELWFGDFIKEYSELKTLRSNSIRSHLNTNLYINEEKIDKNLLKIVNVIKKQKLWSKKIPLMILGFFDDMKKSLEELYKLLKKNGHCIIVVGNSAYGNIAIPTDLILANIALNIGFKKCNIEVARHLGTSSQQYKKVKFKKLLRESVIILTK